MMSIARSSGRFGACILALVALVGALLSHPAHAQSAGATLTGVITDKSGALVNGAKVQIKNLDNGQIREVTTNESGLYSSPNLQPGPYEVKVTASGFTSAVQKGVVLNVGTEQALNITLQVGQVTETVEVSDLTPAIETTSSTVGATVEQRTVVELPLNGRDWTQLATLQPGIISVRAQASTGATANRGNRGFGDQLADSGHRPNENTYRVDGININDYSNGAPGSVLGASLGVDAIQEFSVVTTNYTAEYGRTSGAVINAITKSGTNQVHGSGYFFDRDKIFDAKNAFDSHSLSTPPFRRTQFGGSIGAPIVKDRTFIFGDYEGVRQSQSLSFKDSILSAAARSGVLCSTPDGTCTTHTVTIDPKVAPFLPLWQPLHGTDTGSVGNGDTDIFLTSGLKVLNENYFTIRGDHKISDKDSISGTFFYDKAPQTNPDSLDNVIHSVFTQRHTLAFTETHIFSSALGNTFRFGYGHVTGLVNTPVSAINPAAADTSLCTVCSPTPLPAALITVTSLTPAGGLGNLSFFGHHYNTFQANDDVFLTKGKHALKFGFAFERMQYNVLSKVRGNGNFKFSSIENFLTNNPSIVQLLSPDIRKETQSRDSLLGGYIQDDWRVTPRFTANLGLRYEVLTNPTEAHDGFGFLPNFYTGTTTPYKNVFANNPTTRNFDPRIGFSWDPTGSGKTAIRAGFGIFSVLPLPYVYTIGDSLTLPFSLQTSAINLPQGSFPVVPSSVNFGNSAGSRYIDRSPKRSFASNWNINVQRELTSKVAVMVGYVGSRTIHNAFTTDDSNQVVPPKINGVFTWPCGTITGPTSCDPLTTNPIANPNVGFIRPIFFDGASSYEGFQSQVQLRNIRSVQAQVAYTYSNCKDTGSGAQLGDPFQNSISSLIFFDRAHRYGACDFDIRHNLVANYILTLPSPKGGAVKWIAGGWQLGGIISASSGVPFTLILGGSTGDPLGQNSTDPYDYPNRVAGCKAINGGVQYVNPSCFVAAPTTNGGLVLGNNGRNSLYGPKLVDVDFSLFKNTHITERFVAQFRAEFFNVFNHPNLQAPIDNLVIDAGGTAGQIDSTTTSSRQIQLGLKLTF